MRFRDEATSLLGDPVYGERGWERKVVVVMELESESGNERERYGEEEGQKERTPTPGRKDAASTRVILSSALIFSRVQMLRISFSQRYTGPLGEAAVCRPP